MMYQILLIDDNHDDLVQSERALTRELNCRVHTASTVLDAIAACEAQSYDIILIDVHMPELSGPRLKALLDHLQTMASACVMYLTGIPPDHRLHQLVANNIGAVLVKPLDHARIQEMLFHHELWADGLQDC